MQGRQKELTKVTKRPVKVTHLTGAWKEGTQVKYNKPTRNNERNEGQKKNSLTVSHNGRARRHQRKDQGDSK